MRAVEFKTNGAPIHHAVIRVDPHAGGRATETAQDGQPGFDGMAWQDSQDPEGQFIGWAPGRGPIVSPDGMPWRLERGADLVVELHMLAPDKPRAIQPTVALFFTRQPPAPRRSRVKMGSKLIDIPAGQRDYVVTDTYELPVPVDLLERLPARALPRQGHARHGDAARRRGEVAAAHQAVELSLAAGLSLRHADPAAGAARR